MTDENLMGQSAYLLVVDKGLKITILGAFLSEDNARLAKNTILKRIKLGHTEYLRPVIQEVTLFDRK